MSIWPKSDWFQSPGLIYDRDLRAGHTSVLSLKHEGGVYTWSLATHMLVFFNFLKTSKGRPGHSCTECFGRQVWACPEVPTLPGKSCKGKVNKWNFMYFIPQGTKQRTLLYDLWTSSSSFLLPHDGILLFQDHLSWETIPFTSLHLKAIVLVCLLFPGLLFTRDTGVALWEMVLESAALCSKYNYGSPKSYAYGIVLTLCEPSIPSSISQKGARMKSEF